MVNKNGSKNGEHISVINENPVERRPIPICVHGPTLLFKKTFDNGTEPIKFYACSAFRNPKECPILSNDQVFLNRAHLQAQSKSKILGLAEITKKSPKKRAYCHTCSCLFTTTNEKKTHQSHDFLVGISDELLGQPTRFLRPLSRDTKEAQYFFADSTLQCIVNILKQLRISKVICIGAPRLYEYLKVNYDSLQINSIVMDIDSRLKIFYDKNEYFEYNMLNDYYFGGPEKRAAFEEFLKETNDSKTCLFTDPPFACRTEPLSLTLKTIAHNYKKVNSIYHVLPIFWIFPYFMENYIQNVMPEMSMVDYMVNYTNHKLYQDGSTGRKYGSPIRIFTNIPLNSIQLPASEGYRYCKICAKFTFKENSHCLKCVECPSKNGCKYVHCELCAVCVKPSYKHCPRCDRCAQVANHDCDVYQRNITCWICLTKGHNEVNCKNWAKFSKKMSKTKSKSLKMAKKICLLCNKAGHNERNCTKRSLLLKETKFLGEICNIFTNKK